MKRKTCTLTQSKLEIIQLIAESKGFHYVILKTKFGVEEVIFFLFCPLILDFK